MTTKRLKIMQEDVQTGDYIALEAFKDGFTIEVEEPWAGDTLTGFGITAAITLTRAQAEQIAAFLLAPHVG